MWNVHVNRIGKDNAQNAHGMTAKGIHYVDHSECMHLCDTIVIQKKLALAENAIFPFHKCRPKLQWLLCGGETSIHTW